MWPIMDVCACCIVVEQLLVYYYVKADINCPHINNISFGWLMDVCYVTY